MLDGNQMVVNVPRSFVKKSHKYKGDGNGEAKLHIGSINEKDDIYNFFNGFKDNKYYFEKKQIKDYFFKVLTEYTVNSNKYEQVNQDNFYDCISVINDMEDTLFFNISSMESKDRIYIKSKEPNIFTEIIREISFPNITNLSIEKNNHNFFFKLLVVRENIETSNNEDDEKRIVNGNIGTNIIFYGAPGTGKSYGLKEYIRHHGLPNFDNKIGDSNVFRVTLYPDYGYSDFVGQVMPKTSKIQDKDGSETTRVEYDFVNGIFTESLNRAFEFPNESVFLILEEMSRANVAAVFGDIFQLLDRDENGISEYCINNDLIQKVIQKDRVYIPSNMYILGTVNVSDQNVHPMDTAFKRRFDWEYVSTKAPGEFKNNPDISIKLKNGKESTISWMLLYQGLNKYITSNMGLSEDKQIGPFFLKFDRSDPVKKIKNKLLQYLWEDIENVSLGFTSSKDKLFKDEINSFSDLYDKYDSEEVFSDEFISSLDIREVIDDNKVSNNEEDNN